MSILRWAPLLIAVASVSVVLLRPAPMNARCVVVVGAGLSGMSAALEGALRRRARGSRGEFSSFDSFAFGSRAGAAARARGLRGRQFG